jgi:hypothetical protein
VSAHRDPHREVVCTCRCHDDADLHERAVLEDAVNDVQRSEEARSNPRVDLPQKCVETAVERLPRRSDQLRRFEDNDGRTYHVAGAATKTSDIAGLRVQVISETDGLVRMDLFHVDSSDGGAAEITQEAP